MEKISHCADKRVFYFEQFTFGISQKYPISLALPLLHAFEDLIPIYGYTEMFPNIRSLAKVEGDIGPAHQEVSLKAIRRNLVAGVGYGPVDP